MNVFELNQNLINDYYSYIKRFIRIKDNRIDELVQKNLMEYLYEYRLNSLVNIR